jgi:hypothetical protein
MELCGVVRSLEASAFPCLISLPSGGLSGGPLNKRWRFNKYEKDQFFKPHYDAGYIYSKNEQTILTFIMYLNDGFDGGETTFYPGNLKQYVEVEKRGEGMDQ